MKIRDEQLHKLRHHRKSGAHGGPRKPQVSPGTLIPRWCAGCGEIQVFEDYADELCPYCDNELNGFEE